MTIELLLLSTAAALYLAGTVAALAAVAARAEGPVQT